MQNFALTAAAFEASLVIVAILLGRLLGQTPLQSFRPDLRDAAIAVAATLPPLTIFWFCLRSSLAPLRRISKILDAMLMPLLRECGPAQLAAIAILAGVGEEMLFRGVIQAAVTDAIGGVFGLGIGLVVSAVLFGLLHPVTPLYAILASLIGFYLGGLWIATGNLLVPITVRALYDFVAMIYLLATKSRSC